MKIDHTPIPWTLRVGERTCFHAGNRVSITRETNADLEPNCETVAEVWQTSGDSDIADGQLIVTAVNHHHELVALAESGRALALREWQVRASGELGEPYLKTLVARYDTVLASLKDQETIYQHAQES